MSRTDFFGEMCAAFAKPKRTVCTQDGCPAYIWSDGEKILCEDSLVINTIADVLDALGYQAVTGYYAPKEDERNGDTDEYTGNWYVDV